MADTRRGAAQRRAQVVNRLPAAKRLTRSRVHTTQIDEEQDDGQDPDPVNVDFNQVSSASNAARLGQKPTVNGLGVVSDRATAREHHAEHAAQEDSQEEERHRMPGNPTKRRRTSKQDSQHKQRKRPSTRSQNKRDKARSDVYEIPDGTAPPPASTSRGRTTTGRQSNRPRRTETRGTQTERSHQSTQTDEEDEYGGMFLPDDTAMEDDSAFITAPDRGEDSHETKVIIKSFQDILRILAHDAWTGDVTWTSTVLKSECECPSGGRLFKRLNAMHEFLSEAINAGNGLANTENAHHRTRDFLRDRSKHLQHHLTHIEQKVDRICTVHLKDGPDLTDAEERARERLLSDIARRVLPLLVLVVQKACNLGQTENCRGKIHISLDAYTLQILLRTIGWAARLENSLARGLTNWPIDEEFTKEVEERDESELELCQKKIDARNVFKMRISELKSAAKRAADDMEQQVEEAQRQSLEIEVHRQRLLRQPAIQAAMKRQEQEEARQRMEKHLKWQVLIGRQQQAALDPMKEKWDLASQTLQAASQLSNQYDDDDDPFADIPAPSMSNNRQANIGPACKQSDSRNRNKDWSQQDGLAIIDCILKGGNTAVLGKKLGRGEDEMEAKVTETKRLLAKSLRKRGKEVPAWVL